jgi:hypothetical protein
VVPLQVWLARQQAVPQGFAQTLHCPWSQYSLALQQLPPQRGWPLGQPGITHWPLALQVAPPVQVPQSHLPWTVPHWRPAQAERQVGHWPLASQ